MPIEQGDVLLAWTFREYEQHERGSGWYAVAGVAAIGLLIYAFATRNPLFAVIIVMLTVVLYLRHGQVPPELECAITDRGMRIDGRFTPYDRLQDFWIVQEERVPTKLYVHAHGLRPRFGIPLDGQDVERVREILKAHLPESEEREEPTSDVIGRALKL